MPMTKYDVLTLTSVNHVSMKTNKGEENWGKNSVSPNVLCVTTELKRYLELIEWNLRCY